MKIPIPNDYQLPAETEDGQTFEELVTFRVDGDSLVPTMLAGVEIAAEEAEDEDEMEDEAADEMEAASPMAGMGERIMGMA
jgi:mannose/fructose/N-acetylgalactosamine-specific phosphotransferase system component IID